MIKSMLVGFGGTPYSEVTVRRAIELARIHSAKLTGITVVDPAHWAEVGPVPSGSWSLAGKFRQGRATIGKQNLNEAVQHFEHACKQAMIHYTVEHETGDPFDLMVDHSRYHDLIIFSLRGLFDYGIVSEPRAALTRLVEQGVRPLLASAPEYRPVKRALIAYSGSLESARAMKQFVQMRLWPEAALTIACFGKSKKEGENLLDEAAAYCRSHGFAVETELSKDSAREELLSCADEHNADLIVMSNSIRHLRIRHLLGDTLLHVLRHADRPIFMSQ